jgi:GWxTD domain-containing protein
MKKKIAYSIIAVIICSIGVSDVFSQPRTQGRGQQRPVDFVLIDAVTLPSDQPERSTVDIHYRIMKNFFIFIRATDPQAEHPFVGGGEISIELFDSRGQVAARDIQRKKLFSDIARPEFPDVGFIEGVFRFELSPGEYRPYIRISDENSERQYTDRNRRITVDSFPERTLSIGSIIFVESATDSSFRPVNAGGNVLFGRDFDALFVFTSGADAETEPEVTVSLTRQATRRDESVTVITRTPESSNLYRDRTLTIGENESGYSYYPEEGNRDDVHIGYFSLPGATLDEGTYRLSVTVDDGVEREETTQSFQVVWIGKPFSLRDFDFALEMMEYSMPEDEYRQLRRGSEAEKREKFNRYWKAKDPEPDRAYNPVLTEYYRRVDHAMQEFQTIRERNGARTDRGKIYILYGPPTHTDRSLTPGQLPQETWTYTHLNQKFIFVDQTRQGNYQLVAREEL